MRRYSLVIIFFIFSIIVSAQENRKETQNYLPNYTPPSPTVAALMKFEEIPVDNYTGIPDVSIPIFSSPSRDKKINVDISLKYHPASIAVDEIASDVGLGWSLFAGGTISRTVKDLPDEQLIYGKKVGIYHTTVTGSKNNYYNIVDILTNGAQNPADQYTIDEFMWEANEKKKYDTQHDLWQFNFMGHTGRFYIKKNMSTGLLEVVPLDNYNLKIINNYNTNSGNPNDPLYNPISFEIIDTNGYKYFFEEYEETKSIPTSFSRYYPAYTYTNVGDAVTNKKYRSAFQLTKILAMNDSVLVEFNYSDVFNENNIVGKGATYNTPIFDPHPFWVNSEGVGPCNLCPDGGEASLMRLEPTSTTYSSQNYINSKKISEILINGIARIQFTFKEGRQDTCYFNGNTNAGCRLSDVSIMDWNSSLIRKFKLNYGYRTLINKRMFLESVSANDKNGNAIYNYGLEYEENTVNGNPGKDYWGYYNLTSDCDIGTKPKEVTPSFCTTQVLQKMVLPTGGCEVFYYEPNDFSYIGNEPITDFDDNINNWDIETGYQNLVLHSSNGHEQYQSIGYMNQNTVLVFNSTIYNNSGLAGFLKLYKKLPNGTRQNISYLQECPQTFKLDSGFEYEIGFSWNRNAQAGVNTVPVEDLPVTGQADIRIDKKTRIQNYMSLLYGGGIRINKIGYFDKDVNKDYYKSSDYALDGTPKKEIKYSYRLKEEPFKSSGALVFPKPVYKYYKSVQTCIDCSGVTGNTMLEYNTETSHNNLLASKSKGSDVGYKNVIVSETGNGHSEFEYTSSIDNPELGIEYSAFPPFLPLESYDFKRGLLLSKEQYDQSGKILTRLKNEYEIDQYTQNTGFNVFNRSEKSFSNSYKYSTFDIFCTYKQICKDPANLNFNCQFGSTASPGPGPNPSFPSCPCRCYDGEEVPEVIHFVPVIENYGWVKLISAKHENYFYDNGNQNKVEQLETFTYNNLNRSIETQTESTSLQDDIVTKYYYPRDPSMSAEPYVEELKETNIIETPLVTQVYRGATKLSEQKTVFRKWSSSLLLPEIILSSKGAATLESRAQFILYNDIGNPLEVKLTNGTTISYIWGYSNSQPIAKVENATNADIQAVLGTSVNGLNESNLGDINQLRVLLPNALVTTYTYILLKGVETITDPKGYKTTYEYDDFGRLSRVRDAAGKILSENEYNYRTQN